MILFNFNGCYLLVKPLKSESEYKTNTHKMSKKSSGKLGLEGEKAARKYLESLGYQLLEANWRFQKYEVDIIARDGDQMVFIEVKTRRTDEFGEPELFVTPAQQKRIVTAADHYIQKGDITLHSRFDILSILPDSEGFSIKHLKEAFYPALK